MKTKYLFLGLGALLAVGGGWSGRAAWRAHYQLVSLDVRNAPVAEVLRKIERQTWKKIRAEKGLDAHITLHVTDKPLRVVLDRIAEQAGAHWSTLYAVYDSSRALRALDSALRGDGQLEPAGWTKIAPVEGGNAGAAAFVSKPMPDDSGRMVRAFARRSGPTEDEAGPSSTPPELNGAAPESPGGDPGPAVSLPVPRQGGAMMFKDDRNGPMLLMGPNGQVEMWSPEELLMATPLKDRADGERIETATPAAAANTARKVNGRWTTYLAFRKSSIGIGFGSVPGPGMDPLKRGPNDRFARLTPEQRVQRARARLNFKPQ